MFEVKRIQARAIGLHGQLITTETLPPPNIKRWVVRHKAEVVAAVRGGILSLEEACERYSLSVEEFLSWQRLIESHGVSGLRTTKVQAYRETKLLHIGPTAGSGLADASGTGIGLLFGSASGKPLEVVNAASDTRTDLVGS